MAASALPLDPLWPRAGSWPSANDVSGPIDLALIGIPTWRTSLSPTGAHTTPAAVRDALRRYSPFAASLGDRNADELVFADAGDVDEPDGEQGELHAIEAMEDAVRRAVLTVALGGDNAATVPAALGAWGSQIDRAGLVTLDAHHDLRDGTSNGSPVRRLIEAGLDGRRVVQIGIADFANSRAYTDRARDLGITVIRRDELLRRPMSDVMAEAFDIAGWAGGPIHVDFDVDVCDRAVAPACPASVPGGLAAHEIRTAARATGLDPRVRSVDITEIDALADAPDGRTVRLAALCVLELAAGLASR